MVHHCKPEYVVKWLLCSRSQQKFKTSFKKSVKKIQVISPECVKHFKNKLSMMMHHHEPECHAICFCFPIFKFKVTVRTGIIKIWLFVLYIQNCWSFWTNLSAVVLVITQSVLWKDWIAVYKVMVMVQNCIECLSVLCFLYHWYLCNQSA